MLSLRRRLRRCDDRMRGVLRTFLGIMNDTHSCFYSILSHQSRKETHILCLISTHVLLCSPVHNNALFALLYTFICITAGRPIISTYSPAGLISAWKVQLTIRLPNLHNLALHHQRDPLRYRPQVTHSNDPRDAAEMPKVLSGDWSRGHGRAHVC